MAKQMFTKTNLIWTVLILVIFAVVSVLMQTGVINTYYESTIFTICILSLIHI